jgi:hypothetical protein
MVFPFQHLDRGTVVQVTGITITWLSYLQQAGFYHLEEMVRTLCSGDHAWMPDASMNIPERLCRSRVLRTSMHCCSTDITAMGTSWSEPKPSMLAAVGADWSCQCKLLVLKV